MGSALEEIKEKLVGTWKVDRGENVEDFFRELGLNFITRKLAARGKPVSTISIEGDEITLAIQTPFWTMKDTFKLDEEFEKVTEGVKLKAVATYKDGKLIIKQTPIEEGSSVKPQEVHRERVGEELLQTMYIGDVVCKRYCVRVQE
ncbi:hypothetical protein ACJMK2_011376 [Sinanodonta woodiana]|uniref:Lipocalin/cytosolic fatty-acid binding domain-containing protein n=1 Tax=Sinanodonta woodiana TaxID=1069815 RepID=A0ABD3V7V9_SINWO